MIEVICAQESFRHNLLEFLRQKFPEEDENGKLLAKVEVHRDGINYEIFVRNQVIQGNVTGDIEDKDFKKKMRKELLSSLSPYIKKEDGYGILTGVRPLKLYRQIIAQGQDPKTILPRDYLLSMEKVQLLSEIFNRQNIRLKSLSKGYHLYLHIPFCPSKCYYCSFDTFVKSDDKINLYVEKLVQELKGVGDVCHTAPKSIYIGGGTPSYLSPEQMEKILSAVQHFFGTPLEYTVECGRLDTLSEELFYLLSQYRVNRISLNPQTLNQEILSKLNRYGNMESIQYWVKLAKKFQFDINMDLILGLPYETKDSMKQSVDKVIQLCPENITVHNLALKKGSKLYEQRILNAQDLDDVQEYYQKKLVEKGYEPYYLYRQKRVYDNGENMGYAISGKESIYNIVMMEELETVLGFGLGASTKILDHSLRFQQHINYKNFTDYYHNLEKEIQSKITLLKRQGVMI